MIKIIEESKVISNLTDRLKHLNDFYYLAVGKDRETGKKHTKQKILTVPLKEVLSEINKTKDLILLEGIEDIAKEQDFQKGLLYLIDVKFAYSTYPNEAIPLKIKGLSKLKHFESKDFIEMIDKLIENFKQDHMSTKTTNKKEGLSLAERIEMLDQMGYFKLPYFTDNEYFPKGKLYEITGILLGYDKETIRHTIDGLNEVIIRPGCNPRNIRPL